MDMIYFKTWIYIEILRFYHCNIIYVIGINILRNGLFEYNICELLRCPCKLGKSCLKRDKKRIRTISYLIMSYIILLESIGSDNYI